MRSGRSLTLKSCSPPASAPGPKLVDAVQKRIDVFAATYQSRFPSAVKCLLSDRAQLTSYLRLPVEHHKRIRHSNFIERTFGETRRRVKVIGRLPGEASCLSLVWAVLDRASRGWRGLAMTPAGSRLLHDLRRQLFDSPTQLPQRNRHPSPDAGNCRSRRLTCPPRNRVSRHLHRRWGRNLSALALGSGKQIAITYFDRLPPTHRHLVKVGR